MNNQKGFASILLIVLVVILVGALGYVTLIKKPVPTEQSQSNNPQPTTIPPSDNTVSQTPPPTQPPVTPPSSLPTNWKLYTDSQHSFSIGYPKSMSLSTKVDGFYNSDGKFIADIYGPFSSVPVAYIKVVRDTEQTQGFVTVNISTNSNDVKNCLEPSGGTNSNPYNKMTLNASSNVLVSSVSFARADYSGDGVQGFERDYAALHNGACYVIQIRTEPSSCVNSGCEGHTWSLQTEKKLLDELDPITHSFRFISL